MGATAKIIIALIFFNTILASWWVINGNIFFHTDIARDFLLMEDIVDNRQLALIGPRSGAIPGLFHGPLWLYLNIPSYFIGGGNPVIVGWFWIVLYIASLLIIYFVGKKLFDIKTGLLSALLLSVITILNARTLFNPYGALMLMPLYLYFFAKYLSFKKIKYLIITFLILGLMIQFQMAFGIPILILTFFYLLHFLYRNKRLSHIISLWVVVIPLSSHLLFELRNNFLQVRSVLNYLNGQQTHGKLELNFIQLISLRGKEMILDGLGSITQNNIFITTLLLVLLFFAFFKVFKSKSPKKQLYIFCIYLYLGFWLMTIFFKGPLWNYYYIPFIPMLVLVFASVRNVLNSWLFYAVFILIYLINIQTVSLDILAYNPKIEEQDVSTWEFNKLVAENIFEGESEFGYFIFTPDLYGYSPRYALNFYQKKLKSKKVYPFQKRKVTYLVIAPPPEYGKDPNSIWYQKNINSNVWKKNDIKITRDPDSSVSFKNGFKIEKYYLSDEEIKVEANPYLIKDIFFR